MGRTAEPPQFRGMPLSSLRNLRSEHYDIVDFIDGYSDDVFISEDNTSYRPQPGISRGIGKVGLSPLVYSSNTEVAQVIIPEAQKTHELGNKELPIFDYKQEIMEAVSANPITIIVAETGAGKSTQAGQFLLEAGWARTIETQPRRAAARNVYNRIHSELSEAIGESEADNLVSFRTAGEYKGEANARIEVVTDGLEVAREVHNGSLKDNEVLIIDEVHEWNSNIEVLMALVKVEIARNSKLRVVIMSATMDADHLAGYFAEACHRLPPIIEVPGRMHKITNYEKPESNVVDEVLKAATEISTNLVNQTSNGILVFLPGKREIGDTIDEIQRRLQPDIAKIAKVFPLHAKMSPSEQQSALREYEGVKIIVSTDVAQTSLTIPGIKYVIDSGLQRRMELDAEGVQGLEIHPISQADCDQRAGRSGRVDDGIYILTRLDNKTHHTPYITRDKYPVAEILRTDIVRNALRVAGAGLDIDLFAYGYHPVSVNVLDQAKIVLQTLGALDNEGAITEIGKIMNEFPVCAASARMMVESRRYSEQTRAYMAAIVASKEVGGLQYFAYNIGRQWQELTDEKTSDLLAQLDIYIATQDMSETEMREFDLDLHNIERAHEQYRKIAKKVGALIETLQAPTAKEREDLKQCIYAGMVNSIYKHNGDGAYSHIGKKGVDRVISNRSLIRNWPDFIVGDPYRVQYQKGGKTHEKHIIEQATAARLGKIALAAEHLAHWKLDGYQMRAGKVVQKMRRYIIDSDTGSTEEVPAQPSPQLQQWVINQAIENPGPQQIKLRAIKKEVEHLAKLAKDPVKRLTQDKLISLIKEAAPEDISDLTELDNNLRLIMQDRGITLESFVSAERQARIIAAAPAEIEVNGVKLNLSYVRSKPVAKNYRATDIESLTEEIFLPDGRQVNFMYNRKARTLMELKEKLS